MQGGCNIAKLKNKGSGFFVYVLISVLFFSACHQQSQDKQQNTGIASQEGEGAKSIPQELLALEKNTETIFQMLGGKYLSIHGTEDQKSLKAKEKEGANQQQKQGQSQEQGKTQEKKQEKAQEQGEDQSEAQGQSSGQQQQQQQQQPSPTPDNSKLGLAQSIPAETWKEVLDTLDQMHYQWNEYMPKAIKVHASKESTELFSTDLNHATHAAMTRNQLQTLIAVNQIFRELVAFYKLYPNPISPDVKKVKYFVRSAMLHATLKDWNRSMEEVSNLSSLWSVASMSVEKQQQEQHNQLSFSIQEFDRVVKEHHEGLTYIKGNIVLSNIEKLEKEVQNKQGKE